MKLFFHYVLFIYDAKFYLQFWKTCTLKYLPVTDRTVFSVGMDENKVWNIAIFHSTL